MRSLEGLSINLATVRQQWNLGEAVKACARHGISAIDPWRDQVAAYGLANSAKVIKDHGMRVTGYCRGGMFPASDAAGRAAAIDDNKRAVDEAVALGASCVVLVVGGLPQYSRPGSAPTKDLAGAQEHVADSIAKLLEYSRAAHIPLAIEPLHPMYAADRACVNSMRHALDLCDRIDPARSGMLGIVVDLYHVWWDFELYRQIERCGRERLLAFHVCDWLVPTTDLLNDRGMMGDGVIDILRVRSAVEDLGYSGYVEVELFSDRWWARPMDEVLTTCIERIMTVV